MNEVMNKSIDLAFADEIQFRCYIELLIGHA